MATQKELRRMEQAMNRARKHALGRGAIENVRAVAVMLETEGDIEGARDLFRAVEVLLDLRVAAFGGEREPINKHWREP